MLTVAVDSQTRFGQVGTSSPELARDSFPLAQSILFCHLDSSVRLLAVSSLLHLELNKILMD